MQHINYHATRLFCRLLDLLGKQSHIRLESTGYHPLMLEKIAEGIKCEYGVAALYSLAQYSIQNSDAIRDPEMQFLVMEVPGDPGRFKGITIYPVMYQQYNIGIYEESVLIFDHKVNTVFYERQARQVQFAEVWLHTMYAQGFLNHKK